MRFSSRSYVLIAVAVTIAFLAAAEIGLRKWVVPIPFTQANRTHLIYTAAISDAVIGDSHTASTFVITDDFVNLAVGGGAVGDMDNVTREFYRHRSPGRIIVQASPQLFARPMRRADHGKYYHQNIGLPLQIYVFEPGVAANVMDLLDIPDLQRKLRDAELVRKAKGTWHEVPLAERLAITQKRIDKQRPRHTYRELIAATFRQMIAHLTASGVRVCLFRTPVTQEYLDMVGADEEFRWAENFYQAQAQEFGVRYVDYRDLPVNYELSMFVNMDHLAANGAEIVAPLAIQACFSDR